EPDDEHPAPRTARPTASAGPKRRRARISESLPHLSSRMKNRSRPGATTPSGCRTWDVGFYDDQILPRVIDIALGNKRMGKLRRRALEGLTGTVVEIGFGSGTNVPYYPAPVERVYAVDPALVGRKLAAKRLAASTIPVEF